MSATAPNMRSAANTRKIATMAATVGLRVPGGVAVRGESAERAKAASFRRLRPDQTRPPHHQPCFAGLHYRGRPSLAVLVVTTQIGEPGPGRTTGRMPWFAATQQYFRK